MGFFENLIFSSSNEDGRTELAALYGARRILCLTGSGTRPLDMLLANADEVVALDLNPVQTALLDLKIAAIGQLDRDACLAFLGLTPDPARAETYTRLRPHLAPVTQAIFDARQRQIRSGIWYAGLYERLFRIGALGARLTRGKSIDRLFAAPTLEDQAQIWRDEFDDRLWRGAIRLLGGARCGPM